MRNDGTTDRDHAAAALASRLPSSLSPLAELAYNYWWSWTPGGEELFASVDEDIWDLSRRNPIRLLQDAPPRSLEAAADDASFVARLRTFQERFRAELDAPASTGPVSPDRPVAFFCMEFGIHPSLPIFSGGLGVLSGDLLKEASDRRVPFVGVGLLYHQGYTHQRLDTSGWQHEYWLPAFPHRLPAVMVTTDGRHPLTVAVRIRDHDVEARVWHVAVGRTSLYLLDTQRTADPIDQWITSRLYIEDPTLRLAQYALVGIGGMRALRAMGWEPRFVHLNEGHAIFAAAELVREAMSAGASADDAVAAARARTVFTTHTPVAAGNESHPAADIRAVVSEIEQLGDATQQLLTLGASDGDRFGLTEFGLRTSRFANGVSELHGEVARKMWHHLSNDGSEIEIKHITNGVHIGTWMAQPMRELLDSYLGDDWLARASDPEAWGAIDTIPDEALWNVRNRLRGQLVDFVKRQAVIDRLARGEPIDYVETARREFDPRLLTIGFARRATGYKRLHLLTLDPQRALALIREPNAVQVLLAGKAHPADEEAKHIVKRLFELKRQPEVGAHVAYLEDYDLRIAARLVAGCDVWVNLPRPPLEASGTSGMKAAMNGVLNLSVLDGWWAEAYDGNNGWAIASDEAGGPEEQDARDAKALYDTLENDVIPLFNDRDDAGVPRGWMAKIKNSLQTNGPRFSATRMLRDYVATAYRTP